MLGVGLQMKPGCAVETAIDLPVGFGWDGARFPVDIRKSGSGFRAKLNPRNLVNDAIWNGAAIHVDGVNGEDTNSGIGSVDGDFSAAKRTIHAAFVAGNSTGAPYRVIIKSGQFEEGAFTRNGNDEPDQAVAILGWGGPVTYRTGPFSINWSDDGGTHSAQISSVKRVFRTDQLTERGLFFELVQVNDPLACQSTLNSWCDDGGTVHVNIGKVPGAQDIAVIRSFHGARFLSHDKDIYLEDIHCQGGITGALHCDAIADRNIVGVRCSFRYSAPSNPANPLDAVQIRRTNGLAAFFDCNASGGAEDGWSFHEDGHPGLHVLMQNCTGFENGTSVASSCNGFTTHDGARSIDLNGSYGWSRNGTEIHCIQSTHSWFAGTSATARDEDGSSTAFKCSNASIMWLQDTAADAAGGATNHTIEANGGTVRTRGHHNLAGSVETSIGGTVSDY